MLKQYLVQHGAPIMKSPSRVLLMLYTLLRMIEDFDKELGASKLTVVDLVETSN